MHGNHRLADHREQPRRQQYHCRTEVSVPHAAGRVRYRPLSLSMLHERQRHEQLQPLHTHITTCEPYTTSRMDQRDWRPRLHARAQKPRAAMPCVQTGEHACLTQPAQMSTMRAGSSLGEPSLGGGPFAVGFF